MSEPVSKSFVLTKAIGAWLKKRAEEEERSESYILRKILAREMQGSEQAKVEQKPANELSN